MTCHRHAVNIHLEKMANDAFIISQLRNGEDAAYRYIFDHEYTLMCRFANKIVHDYATAESIADEVIFNLWEKRESLDIRGALRTYLLGAVRNRSINELKARLRRMSEVYDKMNLENEINLLETVFKDEEHPLGIMIEKELESKISECIEMLPPDSRRVFRKSRIEGKAYKEISDELGISVNTVKYHIKQSLAFIHKHLDGYLKWIVISVLFH